MHCCCLGAFYSQCAVNIITIHKNDILLYGFNYTVLTIMLSLNSRLYAPLGDLPVHQIA